MHIAFRFSTAFVFSLSDILARAAIVVSNLSIKDPQIDMTLQDIKKCAYFCEKAKVQHNT
jgi:hypothetical protein